MAFHGLHCTNQIHLQRSLSCATTPLPAKHERTLPSQRPAEEMMFCFFRHYKNQQYLQTASLCTQLYYKEWRSTKEKHITFPSGLRSHNHNVRWIEPSAGGATTTQRPQEKAQKNQQNTLLLDSTFCFQESRSVNRSRSPVTPALLRGADGQGQPEQPCSSQEYLEQFSAPSRAGLSPSMSIPGFPEQPGNRRHRARGQQSAISLWCVWEQTVQFELAANPVKPIKRSGCGAHTGASPVLQGSRQQARDTLLEQRGRAHCCPRSL